tara:strand:- start:104 stop:451 length:348 start_codon:yes stop_codon:yes gene_type:complete
MCKTKFDAMVDHGNFLYGLYAIGAAIMIGLTIYYFTVVDKKSTKAKGFVNMPDVQSSMPELLSKGRMSVPLPMEEDPNRVVAEIVEHRPTASEMVRRQRAMESGPLINTHDYDSE